jgi:hypothetical protein
MSAFQKRFRSHLQLLRKRRSQDIHGGWAYTTWSRQLLIGATFALALIYIGLCVYVLLLFGASHRMSCVWQPECAAVCVAWDFCCYLLGP